MGTEVFVRWSRKKPALNEAYDQRFHRDQSNLMPLDPEAVIQNVLRLLASVIYFEKGMASWL